MKETHCLTIVVRTSTIRHEFSNAPEASSNNSAESVVTGDTPWRSHRYMKQVVTRSETRINTVVLSSARLRKEQVSQEGGGVDFFFCFHRDWLVRDKIAQQKT